MHCVCWYISCVYRVFQSSDLECTKYKLRMWKSRPVKQRPRETVCVLCTHCMLIDVSVVVVVDCCICPDIFVFAV